MKSERVLLLLISCYRSFLDSPRHYCSTSLYNSLIVNILPCRPPNTTFHFPDLSFGCIKDIIYINYGLYWFGLGIDCLLQRLVYWKGQGFIHYLCNSN